MMKRKETPMRAVAFLMVLSVLEQGDAHGLEAVRERQRCCGNFVLAQAQGRQPARIAAVAIQRPA